MARLTQDSKQVPPADEDGAEQEVRTSYELDVRLDTPDTLVIELVTGDSGQAGKAELPEWFQSNWLGRHKLIFP